MPEEITLAFIGRQLERVLAEQREMRLDFRSFRDEFGLLREQVRIQRPRLHGSKMHCVWSATQSQTPMRTNKGNQQ